MPLNILKRTSQQYNVINKSTFVISVELLDNGVMECTLDANSSGKDCLLNISQRLGLHQPEFFGLGYISRGVPPRKRWVELHRPLKKQLEKHAQDLQLSLGVMFYVTDVNLLKDEMARYHYFLQLKSDVIDGKVNCTVDQAISLAAYSLQAEFGDYDPGRHTVDYLRDFAILPKELIGDSKYNSLSLDSLFETVAKQYGSLIGFPPPLAEIYYIMVAQQLDGYGQEAYPCKDDSGQDILLCVSLNGIVIRRRDWTHITSFSWADTKSCVGHKKFFFIESIQPQRTKRIHFSDPEVVKYVRKMCLMQKSFGKESALPEGAEITTDSNRSSSGCGNYVNLNYSLLSDTNSSSNGSLRITGTNAHTNSVSFGVRSDLDSIPLGTLGNLTDASHAESYANSSNSLNYNAAQLNSLYHARNTKSSTFSLLPDPHNLPDTSLSTFNESELKSFLPAYRPAPDYRTALRHKYARHVNIEENVPSDESSGRFPFSDASEGVYENGPLRSVLKTGQEVEPIYQNGLLSQMHNIKLQSNGSTDHINNVFPSPEVIEVKPSSRDNDGVHLSEKNVPDKTEESSSLINADKKRATTNLFKDRDAKGVGQSLFFKPPPPYPGPSVLMSTEIRASGKGERMEDQSKFHCKKAVEKTHDHSEKCFISQSFQAEADVQNKNDSREDSNYKILEDTDISTLSLPQCGGSFCADESTSSLSLQSSSTNKEKMFSSHIDKNILEEFNRISKAHISATFTTALKRENTKRNRYFDHQIPDYLKMTFRVLSVSYRFPDVLPYEENMIRLSPTKLNPSGYINSSSVMINLNERCWRYIVGQIPLAGNVAELWQMMWETNSKVLVVLERDSAASFYPPDHLSSSNYGDFHLSQMKMSAQAPSGIAREFTLTFLSKRKQKKVWILPYEDEWKDDVPVHTEHFLCFLDEVNSVQRKVGDSNTPLSIFCGTGAGRSGVLVFSDLLLHAADSGHKIRADVLLEKIRKQRMAMVSTASQYAFVLDTLAKYLAQSRLI